MEKKHPNFFIVGAAKAGTTSIYEYLKDIPNIFFSAIKEPNYFSINTIDDIDPLKPIRNKEDYLNLFSNANDSKVIGEASPYYLTDPESATLIYNFSPDSKILISLRDPVERMFSHYLMEKRRYPNLPSFHEQLKIEFALGDNSKSYFALKHGLYHANVKRYLDIFGRDQVKIIIFEDFINNPTKILQDILNFLKINYVIQIKNRVIHNAYYRTESKNFSSQKILQNKKIQVIGKKLIPIFIRKFLKEKFLITKITKKPNMANEDRINLINYYKDDVLDLKRLLGNKINWKNFYF